jgi:hypothetical protein
MPRFASTISSLLLPNFDQKDCCAIQNDTWAFYAMQVAGAPARLQVRRKKAATVFTSTAAFSLSV